MLISTLVIFGLMWCLHIPGAWFVLMFGLNLWGCWILWCIVRYLTGSILENPMVIIFGVICVWIGRMMVFVIERFFPRFRTLWNGRPPMTGSNTLNQALDDTVVIDGVRVTLAYLDTLGLDQVGKDGDGLRVRQRVRDFLAKASGFEVLCTSDPADPTQDFVDAHGRKRVQVAIQTNGIYDIGLTLIHAGLALAASDAPADYIEAQQEATSAERGIWATGGLGAIPDLAAMFYYKKPSTGWVVNK